jgi:hypothetical protein
MFKSQTIVQTEVLNNVLAPTPYVEPKFQDCKPGWKN